MGANTSTASEQDRDKILKRVSPQFSQDEGQAIKILFASIANGPERIVYGESSLKAYIEQSKTRLSPTTASGLFHALLGDDKDRYKAQSQSDLPQQSFEPFARHTHTFLKGSIHDQIERLFILFAGRSPTVTKISLQSGLIDIFKVAGESQFAKQVYPHLTDFPTNSESVERLCSFLLETFPRPSSESENEDFNISQSLFEDWILNSEITQKIIHLALSLIFYQESPSSSSVVMEFSDTVKQNPHLLLVPVKITHPLIRERFPSKLLDYASLTLLSNFIPTDFRGKLCPLFSSFHHGESYSMFCKQLVGCRGPTLIVAKDMDGYLFGAFAAEKWQFGPKFRGNANCFLFTLSPVMGVYLPSGYNDNYMYLEQNAQTLPNGLGMGGQMEYFGLWLSADYGNGHSKAKPKCSTYNSPRLSKEEEFKMELLEVWGVGDPVIPEEVDSGPSILDKDKAASTLLEMAGKKLYSKDVREAPEEN